MGSPSQDRHWRVYLWMGLVLLALALALAITVFILIPPGGDSWISALIHYDWSPMGGSLVFGLMGIGGVEQAYRSHKREEQRARALVGDERAMPLALIKPQGVAPADLEHEDLALLWLPERHSWAITGLMIFLAFLLTGAVVTVLVAISLDSAALIIGCGVAVAVLEIAGGVWLRTRRRTDVTGVVATSEGLRAIRASKEQAFIPWGDARLLEAWRADNRRMGFSLTSTRALAEWRDYSVGEGPGSANGASREEMYLQAQTLLRTVIARTGLEPRECAPRLTFEEQLETSPVGPWAWLANMIGYAFLFGIVGALLLTAASALLVPLTHSLAVNFYIAVTMGGVGLLTLTALLWPLVRQLRCTAAPPVEHREIHLPLAPEIAANPLRMRVLRVWRDNLILSGILLLIAGEAYALVRVFMDSILPLNATPPWWDPRMFSLATLTLYSLVVGVIVVMGLSSRTPRATIDDAGLRLARGAKRILIPWDMVAELEITVERGGSIEYKAIAGDSQRTALTWPAQVALEGVTLAPGESPGEVFAAAIAQRAGLTPKVVYR